MVRTAQVTISALPVTVTGEGTVEPALESSLASQVLGQVVYVSPSLVPGGAFKKGDVLLKVDPRDFELAITLIRAKVREAETVLKEIEEEADAAKEEWTRVHGKKAPPLPPLVAKAPQLVEAKASLEAARAQLTQAKLDLERTELKAPFDGIVISKLVDMGQYIKAGEQVATVFGTDEVEIVVSLEDKDLAWISVPGFTAQGGQGSLAMVRANFAGKEQTWSGQVVRAEGKLDERTRLVPVVVRVKDPYAQRPPLAVGLYVQVEFTGLKLQEAVVLPRSALRENDTVWVVDDKGVLSFRPVEVARLAGDSVIITDGLNTGEQVAISRLKTVSEGMKVRAANTEVDK